MDTVIDPVCGMEFERSEAAAQIVTDNNEYYFCSQDCLDLFQASPQDYINVPPVDPAHPDESQDDRSLDRSDPG
jgi:YHS domain-containing protein